MSELVVASSRPRTSRDCVPPSSPSFLWRLPSNALSCPFFFSNPRIDACFRSLAPLRVFSPVIVRTTGLSRSPFLGVMAGLPSASSLAGFVPPRREPSHPGGTTLAIEGPIASSEATVRGDETLHQDAPVTSAVSPLPPFQQGRRSRETTLSAELCAAPVTFSLTATPSKTPVTEVARRESSNHLYGGAMSTRKQPGDVGSVPIGVIWT